MQKVLHITLSKAKKHILYFILLFLNFSFYEKRRERNAHESFF